MADNECWLKSKNTLRNNQNLVIYNFNSLDELKFKCESTYNVSILRIKPNTKIILDNSLNLTGLKLHSQEKLFVILLDNFKGIDLNMNSFRNLKINNYLQTEIWWSFSETYFEFYLNNSLIDSNKCNSELPINKFFSFVNVMDLKLTSKSLYICPFSFRNVYLKLFIIFRISFSILEANQLSFLNTNVSFLNSSIYQLQLSVYHQHLDENFLNTHVFRELCILDINGPLDSIKNDLFKSFKALRLLRIRNQNIKNIFVYKNKWLSSLNENIKVDPENQAEMDSNEDNMIILVIYQSFENVSFYDFPNEDLCYFRDFPHQQLVLPQLKPTHKSKCSCTELFLIQYSIQYSESIDYSIYYLPSYYPFIEFYFDSVNERIFSKCNNKSFNFHLQQCNLIKRFSLCKINQTHLVENDSIFIYIYDLITLGYSINRLFSDYINLIFSIVATSVNFLLIVLLSDKKIMSDKMYTHLLVNSCLNFVYSTILALKYIIRFFNEHAITGSLTSIISQYINIILIKYIGNLAKTGANISHVTFTLCRYISITAKKSTLLEKFYRLNAKKSFFLILLFSILINLYNLFQFTVKESDLNTAQLHSFSAENYSNYYKQEQAYEYKENFTESEYVVLNILQYIKIVFSDLFYILVSSLIDVFLLIFINKKIQIRKTLVYMNPLSSLIINPLNGMKTNQSALNKKKKFNSSRNRISQMLLLNGINFLAFRFPLAILSFYGFIFRYNRVSLRYEPNVASYIVCKLNRFCSSLSEVFLFFYLSSFLLQFFIFFRFDTNIKDSALKLYKNMIKKFGFNL